MSCQLTPNILNILNFKPQGSFTFPKQVYEDTVVKVWNERDLLVWECVRKNKDEHMRCQ
jgi:hypothetical protein